MVSLGLSHTVLRMPPHTSLILGLFKYDGVISLCDSNGIVLARLKISVKDGVDLSKGLPKHGDFALELSPPTSEEPPVPHNTEFKMPPHTSFILDLFAYDGVISLCDANNKVLALLEISVKEGVDLSKDLPDFNDFVLALSPPDE